MLSVVVCSIENACSFFHCIKSVKYEEKMNARMGFWRLTYSVLRTLLYAFSTIANFEQVAGIYSD